MGMQDQIDNETNILPSWVFDSKVKEFLGSEGIEIVVLEDDKFRRGKSTKPLVILRGLGSSIQSYLYARGRPSQS